ncbi:MAG: hypothetical protein NXH75_04775 [Halobacteriovoraceae bacterium]|nr:hypothetical protein [Halobacteriovoraceae bacterium]
MKNSLLDSETNKEQDQLKHYQQKEVISKLIDRLSEEDDSTYYLPTVQIANILHDVIEKKEGLNQKEVELLKDLSVDDIHILLSHKD